MLRLPDLASLERKHSHDRVLSVYVDATVHDPAARNAWRVVLTGALSQIRHDIASSPRSERDEYERAVAQMLKAMPEESEMHRFAGWVGFFLPGSVIMAGHLDSPVPNIVKWTDGIWVSPMVLALKKLTPVEIVIADHRQARIMRYSAGALKVLEELEADTTIGPIYHMSNAPRVGFHTGTRGTVGTDEAARVRRAAATRMYAGIATRLSKLPDDAWLLVGGTKETCDEITDQLPTVWRERVIVDTSLHSHSGDAEIAAAARNAESALREMKQHRAVHLLTDQGSSGGRAALGVAATHKALNSKSVRSLFFSARLLDSYPDLATSLVRMALQQGADVTQVTGTAAEILNHEFEGIAAQLRFVPEGARAAS